jgi:hypothetical protein
MVKGMMSSYRAGGPSPTASRGLFPGLRRAERSIPPFRPQRRPLLLLLLLLLLMNLFRTCYTFPYWASFDSSALPYEYLEGFAREPLLLLLMTMTMVVEVVVVMIMLLLLVLECWSRVRMLIRYIRIGRLQGSIPTHQSL